MNHLKIAEQIYSMCSPVVFVASIGDEYSFSLVRKVVPNVFVSFCLLFPSCILLNFLHSKLKRPVIENANCLHLCIQRRL